MTDRLTIDQVRVGMKVLSLLREEWTVTSIDSDHAKIQVGGDPSWWPVEFFHAPALPAMTAELVDAARCFHADPGSVGARGMMLVAIERAGILPPPAPEQPALPAMYLGEDAFQ